MATTMATSKAVLQLRNAQIVCRKPIITADRYSCKNSRNIWGWLNTVFNKVDEDRIKECGPDRAATEWLIRCGASVRWRGHEKYHADYNTLPSGRSTIEAIDATDSCVMNIGFAYLKNLKNLREINFTKCHYLEDSCLRLLSEHQGDQLRRLRVVSCGNISDKGVAYLTAMKVLEHLYLFDLPAVKNREGCIQLLQSALPKCKVEFPSVEEAQQDNAK